MSLVEWNEEMSVGINSIDNQHKNLLKLLNDLHSASEEGRGAEVVGQTLDGLIAYTVEHFQYEEKLFKETNYPQAAAHCDEHAKLTETVIEIRQRFKNEALEALSKETLLFLVNWLVNHTLGSDQDYKAHLIAAGVK